MKVGTVRKHKVCFENTKKEKTMERCAECTLNLPMCLPK